MSLFIEYYEVPTANGYEYYFMPYDRDAKNKENMDRRSHRIWRMNKQTHKFKTIKDIRENAPEMTVDELFSIIFSGKPVPWDENYLFLQRVREELEQHQSLYPSSR